MAIPSSSDYTLDVDQIFTAAHRRLRMAPEKAVDLDIARDGLQFVFSSLASVAINLWTLELRTLDPPVGVQDFVLDADIQDVLEMVYRVISEPIATDIPVVRMPRDEYLYVAQKTAPGPPARYYLERKVEAPILHLDRLPERPYRLAFWVIRKFKDVGTHLDNIDTPTHWLGLIVAGVAHYLGMCTPDLTDQHREELKATWASEFDTVSQENRDRSPLTLRIDLSSYMRI